MDAADWDIVKRCLNGDINAFSLLVDRYKIHIFNFVYRMIRHREESNDLTQEVFIKAYKNLWRFNPDYKFSTWLFQIARNTTLDYLRKKKPLPLEEGYIEGLKTEGNPPEDRVINKENRKELERAIEKLPSHLKTPLVLYHINRLSYKEIAKIENVQLHTVKNNLFRARKKLRQILKEGEEGSR